MKAPVVMVGRQSRSKVKAYRTRQLHAARRALAEGRRDEAAEQARADRRIERGNRRIEAALRGCS